MSDIEDQEDPQEGCDATPTGGCADGMAEAAGEMIAVSAAWIDIEDAMRGVIV